MPKVKIPNRKELIKKVNRYLDGYHDVEFQDPETQIANWDVSSIKNMSGLFRGLIDTDIENDKLFGIENWDVSNVKNMESMFRECTAFDQPLNKWNVSKVQNMKFMFHKCREFDRPLNGWNVSKVKFMDDMFSETNFNQHLNTWDLSSLESTKKMFYGNEKFNQPLYNWNVSNVENMSYMFCGCIKLNGFLMSWDVSNVTTMKGMFKGCVSFNEILNYWNPCKVENMSYMFESCSKFNNPLHDWNVSKVKDMSHMFENCSRFNGQLHRWNVQNVQKHDKMFQNCPIYEDYKPRFGVTHQSPESYNTHHSEDLEPYYNTNPIAPTDLPDNLLDEHQIQHIIKAEIRDSITMDEYKNLKDYFETTDTENPLAFIFNGTIYVTSKEDLANICQDKSFVKYICKRVSTGIAVTQQMIEPEPYITGRSFGCLCGLIPMSHVKYMIENGDERVFYIQKSKTKTAPSTASLQMLLPNPNAVGASHCQAGQDEQVNDVYVFDFEKYQKRKRSSSAESSKGGSSRKTTKRNKIGSITRKRQL